MSRSYKHTPGTNRHRKSDREYVNRSKSKVRHMEDLPNGMSYRRVGQLWGWERGYAYFNRGEWLPYNMYFKDPWPCYQEILARRTAYQKFIK
jgi:hypothetical protein